MGKDKPEFEFGTDIFLDMSGINVYIITLFFKKAL